MEEGKCPLRDQDRAKHWIWGGGARLSREVSPEGGQRGEQGQCSQQGRKGIAQREQNSQSLMREATVEGVHVLGEHRGVQRHGTAGRPGHGKVQMLGELRGWQEF